VSSRRFRVLRHRAKLLHVLAALAAILTFPLALAFLLLLFFSWSLDVTQEGILRDTFRGMRRFLLRVFSGHFLRPFTLRSVSGARF